MSNKFSIKSMIFNDYGALLAVVFPLVGFGIALIIRVFGFMPDLKRGRHPLGTESIDFFIIFGAVGLVIGAAVLIWKYRRVSDYFCNGIELKGIITNTLAIPRQRKNLLHVYKRQ